MKEKIKLFSVIEPSDVLKKNILDKIEREETKKAMYKIVFSSLLSLLSVSTLVIFVTSIIKDTYQSGLYDYLLLMISDGSSLLSYWQAYSMSIIESLPILQITVALGSVSIFMWSVNMMLTNIKNTRSVFNHAG